MIRMTLNDKIPWTVVILFKGDKYGLDNCLIHDSLEPLVEFYDRRYDFDKSEDGVVLGQFVSRYNMSTLREHTPGVGLNLHGGVSNWSISAVSMDALVALFTIMNSIMKVGGIEELQKKAEKFTKMFESFI